MIAILVPRNLSFGVVSSQILVFAKLLCDYKKVVLVVGDRHFDLIQNGSFELDLIKYEDKEAFKDILNVSEWIYIRSFLQFFKYYFKRKFFRFRYKIFYDFRGLVHNESFLRNNSKIRENIIWMFEYFAANKADSLGAVSQKLRNFLVSEFKTLQPVYIMPCCIEKSVQKLIRTSDRIQFVYLGGLAAWQCFDDILLLYRSIARKIENTSLTVITNQINVARVKLTEMEIENYQIRSLSHEEVIRELPQYDFGFLLREPLLLNQIASPIKFLEYTSSGVIPIISYGIGDFSDQVLEVDLGIVLDDHFDETDVLSKIKRLLKDNDIYKRLYFYSKRYEWNNFVQHHPLVR